MAKARKQPPHPGVSLTGIPVYEKVPLSVFGKRSTMFNGTRIRYVEMVGAPFYEALLVGRQNILALAQYMCNKAHERSMGKDTEIAPIFEWMERFLTIAVTKHFPEMPLQIGDAVMWGMLTQQDRESFSRAGLWGVISRLNVIATSAAKGTPDIILNSFDPILSYEELFVNNPDPNAFYRIAEQIPGTNRWKLKYSARYTALQWMMAYVQMQLEKVEQYMDEPEPTSAMMAPTALKLALSQIKLLREAYSLVEACYAEWVEFLRNSGQLGTFYSPELAGIVEAPQERRPPPLLEH